MYTAAETAELERLYTVVKYTPLQIAEVVGKPTKSVIAKLSMMGIYKTKTTVSKVTGAAPKTKQAFVLDICKYLNTKELLGLEKAPKATLMKLKGLLKHVEI